MDRNGKAVQLTGCDFEGLLRSAGISTGVDEADDGMEWQ